LFEIFVTKGALRQQQLKYCDRG